jgi:RNA polymerase sigma-70 factor (ECF subfamily)
MFGSEPSPEVARMRAPSQIPSLSEIYRTYVRDVGRWAERLAGPEFDLPDMVHEVFEIVQRRLPSYRGDSSLKTWLYGITEKVVRHRRRKDRLRHWLSGSAKDVAKYLPAPGPSQLERLEQKERSVRVYRVFDRLPERDREILILFELEELPGAEIAALLGIKLENVWLRMHRARERFLKAFQESESEIGETGAVARPSGDGRYGHAG